VKSLVLIWISSPAGTLKNLKKTFCLGKLFKQAVLSITVMSSDRLAQLIGRKLSGEATPDEIREMEALLKESPESQYLFEIFSDYWSIEPAPEANSVQEDVHFQQILAIAEKEEKELPLKEATSSGKPGKILLLKRILVAAVILGLIAVSYFYLISPQGKPAENLTAVNEVMAKSGSKMYLLLPDGTKVWLNSESKLEYKNDFNGGTREVTLEGEAFFDVVKDRRHPFIVHTSEIDVRVLGTAFNVKSYPKESYIETTLIRGLIEVTNKKDPNSPKVYLYPHDKLVFNKESGVENNVSQTTPANAVPLRKPFAKTTLPKNIADSALVETSWMYNKLVFDGETLRENASKLERWYNVKIRFKDNKVGNTPIRYPLVNETIEEALKALQYIEPFNYKIKGNEIEIWKK
jgi:transmembrane sensor